MIQLFEDKKCEKETFLKEIRQLAHDRNDNHMVRMTSDALNILSENMFGNSNIVDECILSNIISYVHDYKREIEKRKRVL